ncbi:MAG: FIST N-terminal domain-containing protein [Methanobacteriota archaeon]
MAKRMELNVLVQSVGNLSVGAINDFIFSSDSPRLVLVYSCIKSDAQCIGFFEELVNGLNLPFVGTRSTGVFTPKGFVKDGVVVGVLCGDFKVDVFRQSLGFDDMDNVVDTLSPKINGKKLCLVHSANQYPVNIVLDELLRRLNSRSPDTQFVGGVSAPNPMIASREGIFNNMVVFTILEGLSPEYGMYTGYTLDDDSDEYAVTKSDNRSIREINGENAAKFFSGMYHVRPYFWNMVTSLTSKSGLAELFSGLAKANKNMFNIIIRGSLNPPALKLRDGTVDPLYVLTIDEAESRLNICHYMREGSILKKSSSSEEELLKVYDKLCRDFKDAKSLLIFKCAMLPILYDLRHDKVSGKLRKLKMPLLLVYAWGEIGAPTPFNEKKDYALHAGSLQALGF